MASSNFLERNDFELSAQIRLYRNLRVRLEFEVYPMIHIASPDYYESIDGHLQHCDPIFYEGVRSNHARLLTSAYRILAKRPRLGFVTQKEALDLSQQPGELIHADQDADTFSQNWSSLPLYTRLLISSASPIYGVYMFLTMTRGRLARRLEPSSLPAAESFQPIDDENWDRFDEVLLDRRDAHLIEKLASFYRKNKDRPMRAAVVFGAAHCEAVSNFLTRGLRYHVASAKRACVFEL